MWRSYSRASSLLVVLLVGGAILTPRAEAVLVADANADFPINSPNPNPINPYGVWEYGWGEAANGPIGAFTRSGSYGTSNISYGWVGQRDAHFSKFFGSGFGVSPGETSMHGGAHDEFSMLRFTVLVPGVYDVEAPWKPGDSGDADLTLSLNGALLDSTPSTNTAGALSASNLSLAAGDVVLLALGTLGSYFSDNTVVNLTLSTSAVPEASSLLTFGLMTCAALVRRRRGRVVPPAGEDL